MNSIEKKRLEKIYLNVDSIAKEGNLGYVEYKKYVDQVVSDGYFYIFQFMLERKYLIEAADLTLLDIKSKKIYDIIRLNTYSKLQLSLKKIYEKNSTYQIGVEVFNFSDIKIGEISVYTDPTTTLPNTRDIVVAFRTTDGILLNLTDDSISIESRYDQALQFLNTTSTTTTSTTTTSTTAFVTTTSTTTTTTTVVPTIDSFVINTCCDNLSTGSIDMTISMTPSFVYWQGPNGFTSSSLDISNLYLGDYILNLSFDNGYVTSSTITVGTISMPFVVSRQLFNPTCYGGNDGRLILHVYDNSTNPITELDPNLFLFNWVAYPTVGSTYSSTASQLSNLTSGDYTLIVSLPGCGVTQPERIYTLSDPEPIIVTAIAGSITQYGGSTSVDVSAVGGSYNYVDGVGTFDGILAGTHTYIVTDDLGCMGATSIYISEPTTTSSTTTTTTISYIPTSILANPDIVCSGGTTQLTQIGGLLDTGNIWAWYSDIDFTILEGTSSQPDANISVTPTNTQYINDLPNYYGNYETYYLRIENNGIPQYGGTYSSISVPVVATYSDLVLMQSQFNVTCNGGSDGSIQPLIYPLSNLYTYSWEGPNGFTSTNKDISGLIAGDYTLNMTLPCMDGIQYTLTVLEPDAIVVTATPQSTPILGSSTSVDVSAVGGSGIYSGTGTFDGIVSGTYTYTVTDDVGCIGLTTIYIPQLMPGPLSAIASPSTFCEGSSISLTQIGATLSFGDIWTWYSDIDFTILEGTSSQADASLTITPTGNVTYYVRAENNGIATTGYNSVDVLMVPTIASIGRQLQNITCHGANDGSIVLVLNNSQVYTYGWTGPGGFTSSNKDITGLSAAGTYTVTVSYDPCSYSAKRSYSITEPSLISFSTGSVPSVVSGPSIVNPTLNPVNICDLILLGNIIQSIYSVNPISGSTYTWVVSQGVIIVSDNNGDANATLIDNEYVYVTTSPWIGVYFVSNSDPDYVKVKSCGNTYIRIDLNKSPANPSSIQGPHYVIDYISNNNLILSNTIDIATYSVMADPDVNYYTWTLPSDAYFVSGQGTNQIGVTFGSTFSNGYISVVSNNSCGSSTPSTYYIEMFSATSSTNVICQGGGVTLSQVGGSNLIPSENLSELQWVWYSDSDLNNLIGISNQDSAEVFVNPSTNTTYYLILSSQRGQSATSSVSINVMDPSPSVSSIIKHSSSNNPGDGSISIDLINSNFYTYGWTGDNGFTSSNKDISGLSAGSYTVTISYDPCGYSITNTYLINQLLGPLIYTYSIVHNYNDGYYLYGWSSPDFACTYTQSNPPFGPESSIVYSNSPTFEDGVSIYGSTSGIGLTNLSFGYYYYNKTTDQTFYLAGNTYSVSEVGVCTYKYTLTFVQSNQDDYSFAPFNTFSSLEIVGYTGSTNPPILSGNQIFGDLSTTIDVRFRLRSYRGNFDSDYLIYPADINPYYQYIGPYMSDGSKAAGMTISNVQTFTNSYLVDAKIYLQNLYDQNSPVFNLKVKQDNSTRIRYFYNGLVANQNTSVCSNSWNDSVYLPVGLTYGSITTGTRLFGDAWSNSQFNVDFTDYNYGGYIFEALNGVVTRRYNPYTQGYCGTPPPTTSTTTTTTTNFGQFTVTTQGDVIASICIGDPVYIIMSPPAQSNVSNYEIYLPQGCTVFDVDSNTSLDGLNGNGDQAIISAFDPNYPVALLVSFDLSFSNGATASIFSSLGTNRQVAFTKEYPDTGLLLPTTNSNMCSYFLSATAAEYVASPTGSAVATNYKWQVSGTGVYINYLKDINNNITYQPFGTTSVIGGPDDLMAGIMFTSDDSSTKYVQVTPIKYCESGGSGSIRKNFAIVQSC